MFRAVVEHLAGDRVDPEALAELVQLLRGLHRPSTSLAVSATRSGVNPNMVCTSFRGADEPKVCIPIVAPSVPTNRSQPRVDASSIETRAVISGGSTSSR